MIRTKYECWCPKLKIIREKKLGAKFDFHLKLSYYLLQSAFKIKNVLFKFFRF